MKAITHLALFTVAAVSMIGCSLAEPLKGWSEDLDKALEQAKKEKKAVLVEFTGSDWCPPCKMMRKNVFSKDEFVQGASKNFVLVEIDMPRGNKEVAEKNKPLVVKYKIQGFPTVLLLDSDGKEFSRFIASEHPDTEGFLKRLDQELERKDLD